MERLLFAATIVVSLFMVGFGPAVADGKLRKAAEEALRGAVAAQKSRKHDAAVAQFSKAISSGGLARKQMTYALYRRAVSHRAAKRPAQAISDLNSALFFKGDLSETDRAAALKERARAFADAGLKPTAVASTVPQSVQVSSAPAGSVKPAGGVQPRRSLSTLPPTAPILGGPEPKSVNASPAPNIAAPVTAPGSGFRTQVSPTPNRTQSTLKPPGGNPTPAAEWGAATTTERAVGSNATRTSGWSSTSEARRNSAQSSDRTAATSAPGAGSPNSVAGFFANLFGGGQSATSNVARPAAVTPPPSRATGSGSGVTAWATSEPVVTGATARVEAARPPSVRRASRPTPRRTAVETPSSPGSFDIAVAAVRSQASAKALADRLNKKYAGSKSWTGKRARVDKLPATAKRGVLYSVKLGTYTSRGALASQCEKLIADGLECQVLRRD